MEINLTKEQKIYLNSLEDKAKKQEFFLECIMANYLSALSEPRVKADGLFKRSFSSDCRILDLLEEMKPEFLKNISVLKKLLVDNKHFEYAALMREIEKSAEAIINNLKSESINTEVPKGKFIDPDWFYKPPYKKGVFVIENDKCAFKESPDGRFQIIEAVPKKHSSHTISVKFYPLTDFLRFLDYHQIPFLKGYPVDGIDYNDSHIVYLDDVPLSLKDYFLKMVKNCDAKRVVVKNEVLNVKQEGCLFLPSSIKSKLPFPKT